MNTISKSRETFINPELRISQLLIKIISQKSQLIREYLQ